MQIIPKGRYQGATWPRTLRVRGEGGVDLAPGRANDFRRKCSEYTGPAWWSLHRPAPAAIARRWP